MKVSQYGNSLAAFTLRTDTSSLYESNDHLQIYSENNFSKASLIGHNEKLSYPAKIIPEQSLRYSPCDKIKCSFIFK